MYDRFSCQIFDDGAGWAIRKTEGRLLYLGARHAADEAPIWFGQDPSRNRIAILIRLDEGRLRLEFPAPLGDTNFDILEFLR